MQQLEIQYFFPLTEQIPLDLDYTPCIEFQKQKNTNQLIGGNGLCLTVANGGTTWANIAPSTFQFKPDPDAVGYWQISKEMQIWRKERPNWLHQRMSKFFFGFEWKDK